MAIGDIKVVKSTSSDIYIPTEKELLVGYGSRGVGQIRINIGGVVRTFQHSTRYQSPAVPFLLSPETSSGGSGSADSWLHLMEISQDVWVFDKCYDSNDIITTKDLILRSTLPQIGAADIELLIYPDGGTTEYYNAYNASNTYPEDYPTSHLMFIPSGARLRGRHLLTFIDPNA